jgi:hypothetical protein
VGKRKKHDAEAAAVAAPDAGHESAGSPDLSIVLSLALLAGGVATWPALQEVMEGRAAPVRAATLFLLTTLVALVGFGAVALLFHSFGAADDEDENGIAESATENRGGLEPVVAGFDLEREIDAALAPTEGLVHGQSTAH